MANYRNETTGELASAHLIGTDGRGRNVYQRVDGWEPDFPAQSDSDGNWVEISDAE